ncbi:MAG: hypothetical protein Fur0020_07750 [Thermodesulfovibrionia bacterium]
MLKDIGLRLLLIIALTEAVIMLLFTWVHIERHLPPIAIVVIDTLILSITSSIAIYYWVINPMKSLEVLKRVEQALRRSEERYRGIVENSPEVIYNISSDGTITYLSPAFERITGWGVSEWIGKPFAPLIHPDDLPKAMETFQRILRGESIASYELRVISKSGGYLTGEFTSAPQIEDGKVIGEFGIARDITERKRIEAQLYEITHDWEDTFNSITDMVTIHDRDWNIIRANKSAERILHLPILSLDKETKCFRYYHGTEKPPPGCPSCQCLQTGKPATFELFEPHLDMFLEIRAMPRFDSNNNLIGLIHIVRDITEIKRIQAERDKLLADITRAKTEWEMTFDSAMEFMILVDEELNIIRCNRSFADFSGMPINELIGHKCYEFLSCSAEQIGWCRGKTGARKPTEWTEVKTEKGQWLYISHRPVYDNDGRFLYTVIIASDITDIKNTQRELEKRVAELERFYEMAVGRELRIKELKREIKRLNDELSRYKRRS